jgi:hypothetical protein
LICHLSGVRSNLFEEVIVLHKPKCAFNHRVLKVRWPIIGRELTRQGLYNTQVPRPPAHKLIWSDQSSGDTSNSLFPRAFSAKKMNFYAPREIKATLPGCLNDGA